MVVIPLNRLVRALTAAILAGVISCAKEEEHPSRAEANDSLYDGWETHARENISIRYPPGHPHESELHDMAERYSVAIRKDCRFLGIGIPQDTLVVFYYTGPGQGYEMTGRYYPFAANGAIHFWVPGYYGVPLADYLIPRWQAAEPRHEFLKHGLRALLDNAGEDYHKLTLDFIDEGRFVPLGKLAVDTAINSNVERFQSAMAASFVDFVVFHYGIKRLGLLYRSRDDFEKAVETIFKVNVDGLQTIWLDVIKQAAGEQ